MKEKPPVHEHFCYRHPATAARRKCYACGRWICPSCQLHRDHHIFCGDRCYFRWKREVIWGRFSSFLRAHAARFIVYPMLILVAVLILGSLHIWQSTLNRDIRQLAEFRGPMTKVITPRLEPIEITTPVFGARLHAEQIPVRGTAPSAALVKLWENGEIVSETTVDADGHFEFPEVRLMPEGNILQVEYRLPDGQSGFGPAILVYNAASSASDYHYVQHSPDNLIRGNPELPEVALTFDGNSYDNDVEDVIRFAEEKRVPLTIFLTGQFIRLYPAAVNRLASSSWIEIGNHTLEHPHLTTYAEDHRQRTQENLTPETLQIQLKETAKLFLDISGSSMAPLWRAPYGEHNQEIRNWASRLGYTHVGWSTESGFTLDSLDWVDRPDMPNYRKASETVDQWIKLAQSNPERLFGGIFLMHLGTHRPPGDRMIDHLPRLIDSYRRMGFQFVSITTMLRHYRQPAQYVTPRTGTLPAVASGSSLR